jgi:hypothetical protein
VTHYKHQIGASLEMRRSIAATRGHERYGIQLS